MAVPFLIKVTVRSNRVALPESDISKQSWGLIGTSFSIVIIFQSPNPPLESQSARITVSVILQWTTGNWTPSRIHTILPSRGFRVACVGCFIQHPACGINSYPIMGLLMSSQLYAMNPFVDPALASSNVSVTMT
jgi:hypothetical protein